VPIRDDRLFPKTRQNRSARKLDRAPSMSIFSWRTSQFLSKLAKLVYTARQVVSWQGRYNDELDGNGIYTSTCSRYGEQNRRERMSESEWERKREREREADALRYGNFGGAVNKARYWASFLAGWSWWTFGILRLLGAYGFPRIPLDLTRTCWHPKLHTPIIQAHPDCRDII